MPSAAYSHPARRAAGRVSARPAHRIASAPHSLLPVLRRHLHGVSRVVASGRAQLARPLGVPGARHAQRRSPRHTARDLLRCG